MPGPESNAAFTEVLQLGVDTDSFAQQMQQVVDIYTAAINKMPSLDKVSGVAFSDSINELKETLQQLAQGAGEAMGDLTGIITDTGDAIESKMSSVAESIQESTASITASLSEIGETSKRTRESAGGLGDFFVGLTDNFARSAGSLVRSVHVYKTLNENLQVTGNLIMAPFREIANGYTYLQNVQERGSQIQAALLQSVTFSKDWGENVQIAGQQADILVKKVDDFATKLKVSSQTVQTGFTSFLEYGGRNLTGSLNDALGVSAIVTGALQTQTPNIESRRLIQEMQKLAQGAAGDTDKLAAALGLSKDQLAGMVQHAQKYHDLYQEILAYAPGIVERLGQANDRQSSLVATLELYRDRWDALIAGPLFDKFTKILQEILGYLDAHQVQINAIAMSLGDMVGKGADFVEKFLKADWRGLVDTFKDLAKIVVTIGAALGAFVSDATTLVELVKNAGAATTRDRERNDISHEYAFKGPSVVDSFEASAAGPNSAKWKQNMAQEAAVDRERAAAEARVNDEYNQNSRPLSDIFGEHHTRETLLDSALKKSYSAIDSLGMPTKDTGQAGYPAEAPNTPKPNLHPKTGKPNSELLKQGEEELRAEIEKTKAAYQEQYAALDDAVTKNLINRKEAAAQIKTDSQAELDQINKAIDAEEKKAKASGAKPAAIKTAVAGMEGTRSKAAAEAKAKNAAATKAADAETEAEAKAHWDRLRALQIEYGKENLAELKQQLDEGNITQIQYFDAETAQLAQEQDARHQIAQEEVSATAYGTAARQKAVQALEILDAQYTASSALRAEQRIALFEKEAEAQQSHAQTMQKLELERGATLRSSGDRTAGDRRSGDEDAASSQSKMTEQSIALTAALLGEARARNEETDSVRKLTEQLAGLENQRLKECRKRPQSSGFIGRQ